MPFLLFPDFTIISISLLSFCKHIHTSPRCPELHENLHQHSNVYHCIKYIYDTSYHSICILQTHLHLFTAMRHRHHISYIIYRILCFIYQMWFLIFIMIHSAVSIEFLDCKYLIFDISFNIKYLYLVKMFTIGSGAQNVWIWTETRSQRKKLSAAEIVQLQLPKKWQDYKSWPSGKSKYLVRFLPNICIFSRSICNFCNFWQKIDKS